MRIMVYCLCMGFFLSSAGQTPAASHEARYDWQKSCVAQGGMPMLYGNPATRRFCDRPLADAGKLCRAESDCVGECTLPDDYTLVVGQAPRTTGTCQARTRVGCMMILRDGMPARVCLD